MSPSQLTGLNPDVLEREREIERENTISPNTTKVLSSTEDCQQNLEVQSLYFVVHGNKSSRTKRKTMDVKVAFCLNDRSS